MSPYLAKELRSYRDAMLDRAKQRAQAPAVYVNLSDCRARGRPDLLVADTFKSLDDAAVEAASDAGYRCTLLPGGAPADLREHGAAVLYERAEDEALERRHRQGLRS